MKKPIFKSILASYLLISTLIILLNAVSYGNYFAELKTNVHTSSEYKANQIADHLATQTQMIQKYMDALAVNENLKSYISNNRMPECALVEKRIKDELMQASILESSNKIMIFSLQGNSVFVTPGRNYNPDLVSLFAREYGMSYDEILQIVDFDGLYGYEIFPDGNAWIMRAILDTKPKRIAVIAIEVELDTLLNDEIKRADNELIILRNMETVAYNSGHTSNIVCSDEKNVLINDEKYYVATSAREVLGCSVSIAASSAEMNRGYIKFLQLVGLELLVSVVITFSVAYVLARKTYHPVEKVISVLTTDENCERFDWDLFFQNAKKIVEQNRLLVRNEKNSKEALWGKQVVRILRGQTKDTNSVRSIMTEWIGLKEKMPYIMSVVHLSGNAGSSLVKRNSQSEPERDFELEYFSLKNVLDELIFDKVGGGIASVDGQYVLFIRASTEECVSEISAALQQVIDLFDKHLGSQIKIIMSDVKCGYDSISTTYGDLKREIEYAYFWGNASDMKTVQHTVDLAVDGPSINYAEYLDANRWLMNYLELEDYSKAYEVLENMYQNVFSKDKRYFMYNKYRMYGVIALLTLSLDIKRDKSDMAFFQQLNYEERLFQVTSMQQLMNVSKDLFESIIAYEEQRDTEEQRPAWIDDVIDYVNEHYMDDTLSVTMIADEFDFSVSYFSRTFKSYVGSGVLEVIHKVRIQNAKKRLDQGITIKNTARAVGYLDSKALTRSFKKYEGITAEQYVKMATE